MKLIYPGSVAVAGLVVLVLGALWLGPYVVAAGFFIFLLAGWVFNLAVATETIVEAGQRRALVGKKDDLGPCQLKLFRDPAEPQPDDKRVKPDRRGIRPSGKD